MHESILENLTLFLNGHTQIDDPTEHVKDSPIELASLADDYSVADLFGVYRCLEIMERVWPEDLSHRVIGPYRLIEKIGQGGMGTVWKAIQEEPIRRFLAIKLISYEGHDPEITNRFAAERQALAMMEHVNVARIVDADAAENGQLFFAMEFVDGVSLVNYCDINKLPVKKRLELFLETCSGIQHAHQKGIVHRDIKPSNILVSEIDGKPIVKVIDFGLAKLLEDDLESVGTDTWPSKGAVSTVKSMHNQVIGSFWYMSPEQTRLVDHSVDSRTDIFSLGVVLNELLTGSTWLSKSEISTSSPRQTFEAITTQQPVLPSARLSQMDGSQISEVAQRRQSQSSRLIGAYRRDLDWIVAKALEKDPQERYQSVSALSDDVRRFLSSQPIEARSRSFSYVMNKLFCRNPIGSAAIAALLLTVCCGFVLASWGYLRVANAEKNAATRLEQTKNSNLILANIFDDLNVEAVQYKDRAFKVKIAERLVNAADQLEGVDATRPVVELQIKLARSLNALGFSTEALELSKRAFDNAETELGMSEELTRNAAVECIQAGLNANELDVVKRTILKTKGYCESEFGSFHEETLRYEQYLGRVAFLEADFETARDVLAGVVQQMRNTLGDDDPRTLETKAYLAEVMNSMGDGEGAIEILTEVSRTYDLTLSNTDPKTIRVLLDLAWAYTHTSDPTAGKSFASVAYRRAYDSLGEYHPLTLEAMQKIGLLNMAEGDTGRAIELLKSVVKKMEFADIEQQLIAKITKQTMVRAIHKANTQNKLTSGVEKRLLEVESKFSPSHGSVIAAKIALASRYLDVGEFEKARQVLERALETVESNDRVRFRIELLLGKVFIKEGNGQLAVLHCEAAKEIVENLMGRFDFQTSIAHAYWARALAANDQAEDAILMLQNYLKDFDTQTYFAPQQPQMIIGELGVIMRRYGHSEAAVKLLESVVNSGVNLKEMEIAVRELRLGYFDIGAVDKLNEFLTQDLALFRRLLEPRSLILANRLENLADEVVEFEKYSMAEDFLKECIEIYRQKQPDSMEYWMAELKFFKVRLLLNKSGDMERMENARDRLEELDDLMTAALRREYQRLLEEIDRLVGESNSG